MKSNITQGQTLHLEDFTTTKHGILYKTIKESDQEKPEIGDIVTVHYTGCLLQGTNEVGKQFDSSIDRGQPFQFVLGFGQVIKGWELALSHMKVGEERIIILPPHLAYGDRAISVIPANSTLMFDVKLIAKQ